MWYRAVNHVILPQKALTSLGKMITTHRRDMNDELVEEGKIKYIIISTYQ